MLTTPSTAWQQRGCPYSTTFHMLLQKDMEESSRGSALGLSAVPGPGQPLPPCFSLALCLALCKGIASVSGVPQIGYLLYWTLQDCPKNKSYDLSASVSQYFYLITVCASLSVTVGLFFVLVSLAMCFCLLSHVLLLTT